MWLRWLGNMHFIAVQVHVEFLMDKMAVWHAFLQELGFHICIIPPVLPVRIEHIYCWHYINLAVDCIII
jgi:hypothetical protein